MNAMYIDIVSDSLDSYSYSWTYVQGSIAR